MTTPSHSTHRACFGRRVVAAGLTLAAMLPLVARGASPENIVQAEPSFFVRVDVDRADRVYRQGESLKIKVISEVDAYVYVLYKQADGKVFQIFPNSAQKVNRIPAKTEVQIPASDDQFRWRIGEPYGKEIIKVIASKKPIDDLDDPALRQQRFNRVTSQQVSNLSTAMQDEKPADWAEDVVEIVTKPHDDAEPAAQGRRFGVFFGVSNYQFNEETKIATNGEWEANLPCPANNARVTARLMKSMGKLDDALVFVDGEATKANLERAVTQWLPSVTRPGDTVFIMFSGHGGQLPDDNGDEADKKDEWLCVADYVDLSILGVLHKKYEEGKLDSALVPRYNELMNIARAAGTDANAALIRHTGVTDDLFGHWLQRLANRRILVMLDTCHAGGFSTHEKSLNAGESAPAGSGPFDFLDGEVARLKDLGQSDSALIAACGAQQSSYALRPPDEVLRRWKEQVKDLQGGEGFDDRVLENLAVFSYHLAEALVMLPPPASLDDVHARARDEMRKYFVKINEIKKLESKKELTPHEALLFNYCTGPLLMKP